MNLAAAHHAAHHAALQYSSIWYATVAGLIPVLFVALGVDKGTYGDLMKSISAAAGQRRSVLWRQAIAGLILASGLYGELAALVALQAGRASGWQVIPVRLSVIILVVAVVAGPARAFLKAGTTQ